MKVLVLSKREAVERAALEVVKRIKRKKRSVIGFATGKTMIPLYRELVRLYRAGKVDFSKVVSFNLDEYVGLSSNDKRSFRNYMNRNFFSKVNIKEKNINFLDGGRRNWRSVCRDYEKRIKSSGGIDLQILGIGRNGHIGFNEPGSGEKSRTRKVKLSAMTRTINGVKFREALTMGIGTIMDARGIVLLAFGKEKEEIMKKVLEGRVGRELPASFLRRHKDAIFFIDREAAQK